MKNSISDKFIGIGLADKNAVINNNNEFINLDNDAFIGVYFLYSKFDVDRKKNSIYAYNPKDKSFNGYIVNFPHFKQGQEIQIVYDTFEKVLSFIPDIKNRNSRIYKMQDVIFARLENITLTPCIVFYYPGDVIEISKLEEIIYI